MLDAWSRDCEADDWLPARPPARSAPKPSQGFGADAAAFGSQKGAGRKGPMLGLASSLTVHLCATGALFWQWSAAPPEPVTVPEPAPILVTLPPLPKSPLRPVPPGPIVPARAPRQLHAPPQPSAIEVPSQTPLVALAPLAQADLLSLERIETLPEMAPPPAVEDGRETFEGLLQARIEQFRRYPDDALRQRREGTVQVRFRMDRKGKVLEAAVQTGSGVRQLDREALATIYRAQPLPRIPDDRPDVMIVLVPVEFRLKDQRTLAWTEMRAQSKTEPSKEAGGR